MVENFPLVVNRIVAAEVALETMSNDAKLKCVSVCVCVFKCVRMCESLFDLIHTICKKQKAFRVCVCVCVKLERRTRRRKKMANEWQRGSIV